MEEDKTSETPAPFPAVSGQQIAIAFVVLAVVILGIWISANTPDTPAVRPAATQAVNSPTAQAVHETRSIDEDFQHAHPGDRWRIFDTGVPLLVRPEIPASEMALRENLVAPIGMTGGFVVEVAETKGALGGWKRVKVLSLSNTVMYEGWLLAEAIKTSKRESKGAFTP